MPTRTEVRTRMDQVKVGSLVVRGRAPRGDNPAKYLVVTCDQRAGKARIVHALELNDQPMAWAQPVITAAINELIPYIPRERQRLPRGLKKRMRNRRQKVVKEVLTLLDKGILQ